MGNSFRCWLACVLPCGALDLIRIVHLNGYVEEITRPVTAGDILQAYPHHVLTKPCSNGVDLPRRILVISPDSELKKGGIYFLVPDPSLKAANKTKSKSKSKSKSEKKIGTKIDLVLCEQEKKSKSSRRSRSRSAHQVSDWMPHLESIRED